MEYPHVILRAQPVTSRSFVRSVISGFKHGQINRTNGQKVELGLSQQVLAGDGTQVIPTAYCMPGVRADPESAA